MTFKIEKKLLKGTYRRGDFHEFVRTLAALKVGESFLLPPKTSESNYRMAISIVQILNDVEIRTSREEDGLRIGRTA
jgi:hypothetical protein